MNVLTATERKLRQAMKDLGTFKSQFSETIQICAEMMDQYRGLMDRLNGGELRLVETTESGTKKSADALIIEGLRKDILAYQKELGLTPSALKKMNDTALQVKGGNSFADAIAQAMVGAGG
ncbi:MAG: P27 family phage terminase small subunit [Clostridia bacterium]|nr:P27 family phage terminase small subunit [Clostridia bacterium]